MQKVEKILVPIDFTEESARALKRATALAAENGAELIALHVVGREKPARLLLVFSRNSRRSALHD